MGAPEPLREIDVHVDARNGVLKPLGLVEYDDRIANVLDTDLIDVLIPIV